MGHLQLFVLVPGICGRPRSCGGENEWLHAHALLQLHDLLPAPTHGQRPLCAQMQTRSSSVCAVEAHLGCHHSGAVHTREVHRG